MRYCGLATVSDHISWKDARAYYIRVMAVFLPDWKVKISRPNQGGWMDVRTAKGPLYTSNNPAQKTELTYRADRVLSNHGIRFDMIRDLGG